MRLIKSLEEMPLLEMRLVKLALCTIGPDVHLHDVGYALVYLTLHECGRIGYSAFACETEGVNLLVRTNVIHYN